MFKQKFITIYISQIIGQVLQVLASIVVAKIAGPTVLGTVAFATAYVGAFSYISDLGLTTVHIKLIAEGKEQNKLVGTYAVLKMLMTLFFILFLLGFVLVQKYFYGVSFESQDHEYVVLIAVIGIIIDNVIAISRWTYAGKTESAKVELPVLINNFISHSLRIVIVLLGFGAVAIAFGNLVAGIFLLVVYMYMFKGYNIKELIAGYDKDLAKKYLTMSLPVVLLGLSTNLIEYLDKVLLQFFSNSQEVGYYTAGFRFGFIVVLIGNSVNSLFMPAFSSAYNNGDYEYVKNIVYKFERFCFVFLMPFVVLFSVLARPIILMLLGNEYDASITVMIIVNFGMFVKVIAQPYMSVINGMGDFKLSGYIYTSALVLMIGLLFVFSSPKILDMGAIGVSIAMLITFVFLNLAFKLFAKRTAPQFEFRLFVGYWVMGIVMFFAANYLYERYFSVNLIGMASFSVLFLIVIFGLLKVVGIINKEDLEKVSAVFNFLKLKEYIKQEFSR